MDENTHFVTTDAEHFNEVFETYLKPTSAEIKAMPTPKRQAFLGLDDMNLIQHALEYYLAFGDNVDERATMAMGYNLEDLKDRLKRDIAKRGNGH